MSIMWLTDLQALPLLEGTNHTRNVKLNATMGIQASCSAWEKNCA